MSYLEMAKQAAARLRAARAAAPADERNEEPPAVIPEALLARVTTSSASILDLDPVTSREMLGPNPDPHDFAMVTFDVMQAVAQLEAEIGTGALGQTPLLVRGRPLADWLSLDDLARLLRAGKARP